jgi:hypothetical protein
MWNRKRIKYWVQNLVRRFVYRGDWVFSRTACLGNDAFKLANISTLPRWNIQKGRVDVLSQHLETKRKYLDFVPRELFQSREIWLVCSQILNPFWRKLRPPRVILMDSFSELTDQLFEYNKVSFLSHFNDLDWNQKPTSQLVRKGLIPLEEIFSSYERFFSLMNELWGSVPCIYIHFPTKYEQRQEFKERGDEILKCIRELQSTYTQIKVIEIPESKVGLNAEEESKKRPFPYHFDTYTIQEVANQIDVEF